MDTVRAVCFCEDAHLLAVGAEQKGKQGRVRLYDCVSDTQLASWRHGGAVWAVGMSPDGMLLAAAGFDSMMTIYDTVSLVPIQAFTYAAPRGPAFVWTLQWSNDGMNLVVGSWNACAYVYTLRAQRARWRRAYEFALRIKREAQRTSTAEPGGSGHGGSFGTSFGGFSFASGGSPTGSTPMGERRASREPRLMSAGASGYIHVERSDSEQDDLRGSMHRGSVNLDGRPSDASNVPPLPLSRGTMHEAIRAAREQRERLHGGGRSSSYGGGYGYGGGGGWDESCQRRYAEVLVPRATIRRQDRVYAVAPSHDGNKLMLSSRNRLVAFYQLPELEEGTSGAPAGAALGGLNAPHACPPSSTTPSRGLFAPSAAPPVSEEERAEAVGDLSEVLWERRADDVVYTVALSPDERICAYGGRSMSVQVVDAASGRQLFSVATSGSIWSVRLLELAESPSSPAQLKMLFGGEFPHLSIVDMASRQEELHMPVAEGTNSVSLTPQSLAFANGTRVSVYGKAGHHYAWHDPPSFQYVSRLLLKQQHRLTTDSLVELMRLLTKRHPAIVNAQDTSTGVSLIQLAVEGSCHPRIVDGLLRVDCRVGLQPNMRGLTALDTALQLGDAAALRNLLGALLSGRFQPTPAGMRLVTDAFEALSTKYPHEFLAFIAAIPLQAEPELFLSETQNVRLPHSRPFLVCGDDSRCPTGVWEDVLNKYRHEFQAELSGLLQQVAKRTAGFAGVDDNAASGDARPSFGHGSGASGKASLRHAQEMAEMANQRLSVSQDELGEISHTLPSSAVVGTGGREGVWRLINGGRRAGLQRAAAASTLASNTATNSGFDARSTITRNSRMSEMDDGQERRPRPRSGFVRVQSGGLQALRIPFENFAGDPHFFSASADQARPSPLELVVRAVNVTRRYDVFDSKPINILLTYKWIGFARREFYHELAYFLMHMITAVVFIMMASTKFDIWRGVIHEAITQRTDMSTYYIGAIVLWAWTTLSSTLSLMWILTRFLRSHGSKLAYVADVQRAVNLFYNIGQVLVNVWFLVNVWVVNGPSEEAFLLAGSNASHLQLYNVTEMFRVQSQEGSTLTFDEPPFLLTMALVVWLLIFRVIFFFRGFLAFGALMFMVTEVFKKMFPFLMLLITLTLGFTLSMQVLMQHIHPTELAWTNPVRSLFYLTNYGLRFAPPVDYRMLDTAAERPSVGVLYMAFMCTVQLVLLNLLVAIMSNVLAQLRGSERLMARHVRAKLVLDLEQQLLSRILYSSESPFARARRPSLEDIAKVQSLEDLASSTKSNAKAAARGLSNLTLKGRAMSSMLVSRITQTLCLTEKLPELHDVRPRWLHVLMPQDSGNASEATMKESDSVGAPVAAGDDSTRLNKVERILDELRQSVDRGHAEVIAKTTEAVERAIDDKLGQAEAAAQDYQRIIAHGHLDHGPVPSPSKPPDVPGPHSALEMAGAVRLASRSASQKTMPSLKRMPSSSSFTHGRTPKRDDQEEMGVGVGDLFAWLSGSASKAQERSPSRSADRNGSESGAPLSASVDGSDDQYEYGHERSPPRVSWGLNPEVADPLAGCTPTRGHGRPAGDTAESSFTRASRARAASAVFGGAPDALRNSELAA